MKRMPVDPVSFSFHFLLSRAPCRYMVCLCFAELCCLSELSASLCLGHHVDPTWYIPSLNTAGASACFKCSLSNFSYEGIFTKAEVMLKETAESGRNAKQIYARTEKEFDHSTLCDFLLKTVIRTTAGRTASIHLQKYLIMFLCRLECGPSSLLWLGGLKSPAEACLCFADSCVLLFNFHLLSPQ